MTVKKLALALSIGLAVSAASKAKAGNGSLDKKIFCRKPSMVERTIKEEKYHQMFDYEKLLDKFRTYRNANTMFFGSLIEELEKEAERAGNKPWIYPAVPLAVAVPLADHSDVYAIAAQTFRMCDMPDKYAEYMLKEIEVIKELFGRVKKEMPQAKNSDSMEVLERFYFEDYFLAMLEYLEMHVSITNQIMRKGRLVGPGLPDLKPQEKEVLLKLKDLLKDIKKYFENEEVVRTVSRIYLKRKQGPFDPERKLRGMFDTFDMGIRLTLQDIDAATGQCKGEDCDFFMP